MSSHNYQLEPAKVTLRAPAPRIREATFADYPGISRLESRYGLLPKSYEEWKHLWINNPVYYDFRRWPIGWVCENEENEIIGSIGNIPLAYEFDNRPVFTATSRGLVVDSRYRPYAFSLLGQFFNQRNVDLFLNTSVNDRVFRLQELFRALRVPAGTWNQSAFWITNYPGFTRSVLLQREVQGSYPFSYPLSAGLFCWDKLSGKGLRARRGDFQTTFCTRFDESFDVFWEEMRKPAGRRLRASRTREVLDWHFGPALANGRAWVITVHDESRLLAYGIFRRHDNHDVGLRRMRMVDFQAPADRINLLGAILGSALQRCQQEDVHMLEAIGFSAEKRRAIDALKPHRRVLSAWRYFYKANESLLTAGLKDPEAWDPTCFDGDSSL